MLKEKSSGNSTFEFGDTDASRDFLKRNPTFFPLFEQLMTLGNKALAEQPQPKNRQEDVCFGLAHTCREDFLEILFLSVNGYGNAALKLLRGLYERAVTLEFITRYPEKADRFLEYAAIQEHKAMQAAFKLVTPEQFESHFGPPYTVAEVKERFNAYKGEFQARCKECGEARIAPTWDDLDVGSMATHLKGDYVPLYFPAYALPNLSIHATLASAARYGGDGDNPELVLYTGIWVFLLVLQSRNKLMNLGIQPQLDDCVLASRNWYMSREAPNT